MKILADATEECPKCKNWSVIGEAKYRRVFLNKEFSHIELHCEICDWKSRQRPKNFLQKIFRDS